jgi:transposase
VTQKKKPYVISLTQDEAEALKKRIADSALSNHDQKILFALLSFNFWLQSQLERAKLTIVRLKKIFGLPTEKNNIKTSRNTEEVSAETTDPLPIVDTPPVADENLTSGSVIPFQPDQKRKPKFDPNKNHGRYAASDYPGCSHVQIPHDSLKPGDYCPLCLDASLRGKLYALDPREVIRLQGTPLITGTCYEYEKLRCTLCGTQYEAKVPAEISKRLKYDETALSTIAISRYYSGMPFKRLETLQGLQGIPLADATQWDKVLKLYQFAVPVYQALEIDAAQGHLISYDDTGNHILAAHGSGKAVHTTAFVSMIGSHVVYLFYTAQRYAGENLELLIAGRTVNDPLITMSDACGQNIPKQVGEDLMARWILCFCLVHGRRKFYDLFGCFDQECEFVLDIISKIYKHDKHCKTQQMTSEERLKYHQEHSTTLMNALRVWLNNQLLYHLVEDNSGLGQAIRYMLRHWHALTQFLRVVGAPIDNNLCEQAIKVAIRHRRSSLFYKTFKGAIVGDCMMSLIHTAAKNKINPFDYLNELQRNSGHVRASPESWLPWNYQETLAKMTSIIEERAA